ncbi:phosphoenolpyruvate carboxykinase (GTP), partial [Tessaracoccus bendigoensis DSM 12906]
DGAIDYAAAGVSSEDWEALFAIDPEALNAEADDTDVFLARMGTKVPDAVKRQHEEFRSRL